MLHHLLETKDWSSLFSAYCKQSSIYIPKDETLYNDSCNKLRSNLITFFCRKFEDGDSGSGGEKSQEAYLI
jgi:hypothetical protein